MGNCKHERLSTLEQTNDQNSAILKNIFESIMAVSGFQERYRTSDVFSSKRSVANGVTHIGSSLGKSSISTIVVTDPLLLAVS